MKAIKLTSERFNDSLKDNYKVAKDKKGLPVLNHLWLYNKNVNSKKIHRNGISLNDYNGKPMCCVIFAEGVEFCNIDEKLSKIFGEGSFINGAVSPPDKENMVYESYYIKM